MFKDNYNACRIKLESKEEKNKNKKIIFVCNEWLINLYPLSMFFTILLSLIFRMFCMILKCWLTGFRWTDIWFRRCFLTANGVFDSLKIVLLSLCVFAYILLWFRCQIFAWTDIRVPILYSSGFGFHRELKGDDSWKVWDFVF